MRVLVVDDHDVNRRLLTILLEGDGHEVTGAASVGEVDARLAEAVPDGILMDVRLPDGDGLDVVRRLRSDPRFERVRMYAVTAHLMGEAREAALRAGCDGFFEKPLDAARLLETLRGTGGG